MSEMENARKEHPDRPIVIYFYNDPVPACQGEISLLQTPGFQDLTRSAIFVRVQASQSPDVASEARVVRVPTWVFFGPDGTEKHRRTGQLNDQDLVEELGRLSTPRE